MLAERRSLTRAGLSLLALLALASSACDSWLLIINPSSGGALLRIVNVGDRTVGNLVVLFPGERVTFGDLPGRGATPYHSAGKGVFRYAAYEFQIAGRQQNQPVTDWVGEQPMEGSAFTYSVELVEGRQPSTLMVRLVDVRRDN